MAVVDHLMGLAPPELETNCILAGLDRSEPCQEARPISVSCVTCETRYLEWHPGSGGMPLRFLVTTQAPHDHVTARPLGLVERTPEL